MLSIGLNHYLLLSAFLFATGACGVFINHKNITAMLLSVELMLVSVSLNLVAFSCFHNDLTGQVFAVFILVAAVAEAVVGIAVFIIYFLNHKSIEAENMSGLKG